VLIKNPVLTDKWKGTEVNRIKGRKFLNIQGDEKLVVGVGQLQHRKGVEDFIDIAAAMPDVRFVWVGGRPMGKFTEGIKRIDERIKTAPANLQFTGLLELEEMNAMYAAGDIFLFPSYQENCPLAPLEAAAAGLPVVFRDLVEYKRLFNSNYLKAGTTKEFIDITRKLVNDSDFHKYSVNLSEFLLKQFDKDEIEGQLFSLYQQTLNNFLIINQSKS
jgi:1,2-diacylglycerol-3-alpha-glucose alpha-1,2-galactosyltransferase